MIATPDTLDESAASDLLAYEYRDTALRVAGYLQSKAVSTTDRYIFLSAKGLFGRRRKTVAELSRELNRSPFRVANAIRKLSEELREIAETERTSDTLHLAKPNQLSLGDKIASGEVQHECMVCGKERYRRDLVLHYGAGYACSERCIWVFTDRLYSAKREAELAAERLERVRRGDFSAPTE